MTRTYELITRKAKDGKVFEAEVKFEKGHGWDVNYNEFYRATKGEAMESAKSQLEEKVFEYECEEGLI